jgi:hypothetical protein
MAILDDKARDLTTNVNNLSGGPEGLLDPATISLGLDLLVSAIKLYKQCNRPATAAAQEMRSPPFFARRRLRKLIRLKQLPANISEDNLFQAALQIGIHLKDPDVHEMYSDARTA